MRGGGAWREGEWRNSLEARLPIWRLGWRGGGERLNAQEGFLLTTDRGEARDTRGARASTEGVTRSSSKTSHTLVCDG